MKIIEPVVLAPLRREWERLKAKVGAAGRPPRARASAQGGEGPRCSSNGARSLYRFPRAPRRATGSSIRPAGRGLSSLSRSARPMISTLRCFDDAPARWSCRPTISGVGPEAVLGIEINAYAAELARLTVWITRTPMAAAKRFRLHPRPDPRRLDGIVRGDATDHARRQTKADWPEANVVVGNPPLLGGKRMRWKLRAHYRGHSLFAAFSGRVPAEADLVVYWFAKAWTVVCEARSAESARPRRDEFDPRRGKP